MNKLFTLVIIGIVLLSILTLVGNQGHTEMVTNCKVDTLIQQTLIGSNRTNMTTEIRYLVITDKETFTCGSSGLNLKFNNSDIFFRLKKGHVYNFNVAGWGKSMITDYRNILSYEEIR